MSAILTSVKTLTLQKARHLSCSQLQKAVTSAHAAPCEDRLTVQEVFERYDLIVAMDEETQTRVAALAATQLVLRTSLLFNLM